MIARHHLPKASRIAAAIRILVFLSLLTVLISPSVTYAALPTLVPVAGAWNGSTGSGPVTFTVNQAGTQWSNFSLTTVYRFPTCILTFTARVNGSGSITNNRFSFTSATFAFTGTFTSTRTATGTFRFTGQSSNCGVFSQTGTWSATGPITLKSITGNAGVSGATLNYGTSAVVADSNGNYSISVPAGWSGTVTPSKAGYVFTPPSRSYTNIQSNQTGQNYTANPVPLLSISGNVGVAGAFLNFSTGTGHSDANGHYVIVVPAGWSGTVTPSKQGYQFSPPSRSYTNLFIDQSAQDYTAIPIGTGGPDTTGVFRPSNGLLYLKNRNESGFADLALNYGIPGDYPVVGDWDGNGTATIGVYRNGMFLLRNSNTVGFADLAFAFGQPGDQPIAGDWNGDGTDTIAVYRPSTGQFLLSNFNTAAPAQINFALGNVGDVGIAGDWNGDGIDTTGVFRPSNGFIFLKNSNSTGFADLALNYGLPGDMPVTGDWNNDGVDTIGVYRNGQFLLRNSNSVGFADIAFALGIPGDMPIAGDWDGLP